MRTVGLTRKPLRRYGNPLEMSPWSYPEATEEVWGIHPEMSSRRGRASRGGFQGIRGRRISCGELVPDGCKSCSRNGLHFGEIKEVPESPLIPPTYHSKLSVGVPLRSPPRQGLSGRRAASLLASPTLWCRPLSEPPGPKVKGQASPWH